jgi:integrase
VPLPAVSKRLGHSSTHVTASVYAHAMPADEMAAAEAWDIMMRKASEAQLVKQ